MRAPSIGILSTGSYLPKEEMTNEEIAERCGVTIEWIERKTGIYTRRYAAPNEATSDLATEAATAALDQAGLPASELSYLIVSTSTGDFPQPPTSHLVQQRLAAGTAACFDINVVCSGFVFGLELARSLLATRSGGYALVVAADLYSRILDYGDYRTAVLLGDGAGAAVVGPVPDGYGILDVELASRGDSHQLIRVEAGGSRRPTSPETVAEGGHFFRMEGRAVRDFVMDNVPPALHRLLDRAGTRAAEVDHFVPHQANGVLLNDLVERAGMAHTHVHRTVGKYGNVGSASVPVALDDGNRAGLLRDGDQVLLAGFGGGMALGASLVRWSAPR
jgi:acetoacetyl-CoA synthase